MTVVEERRGGRLVAPIDATPARPTAPGAADDLVLAAAMRQAVAYADVFDWPLTSSEIHRFLPVPATQAEVERAIRAPESVRLERHGDLITLPGRRGLVARRRKRAATSARIWPAARWAAGVVARLPFVRLVAITGSLAVDAAERGADVDLFVVTAPGRLWLTRAATILVGRVARLRGVRLCPNYLLAEPALDLRERDVFTAHELVQMVPIAGGATYRALLERNSWYREFVPNHQPIAFERGPRRSRARRIAERLLGARPFDALEGWEMRRKVARLSSGVTSREQRFDEQACKGHFDEHRSRALARYEARLAEMEPLT